MIHIIIILMTMHTHVLGNMGGGAERAIVLWAQIRSKR